MTNRKLFLQGKQGVPAFWSNVLRLSQNKSEIVHNVVCIHMLYNKIDFPV